MKTANYMKNRVLLGICFFALLFFNTNTLYSQSEMTIKLDSIIEDSTRVIKATVFNGDSIMIETNVLFSITRLFMPLPLGKAVATDENGEARVVFPQNLPGDSLGKVTVIAQLEDDESVVNTIVVSWGNKKVKVSAEDRSLASSRSNAPIYLIIVANLIIFSIWGIMGYIAFLVFFRMKKFGNNQELE